MKASDTVHSDFHGWLTRSAEGRLSVEEKAVLARHMSSCPECIERFANGETLALVDESWAESLVAEVDTASRVVDVFRKHTSRKRKHTWRTVRFAVRGCLLALFFACLFLRGLDLKFESGTVAQRAEMHTFWKIFLSTPDYGSMTETQAAAASRDTFLALLHQFSTFTVEMGLVLLAAVLLAEIVMSRYRRRLTSGQ